MRGLYKDIVWLLNDNSLIPAECLGDKAERKFPDFETERWKKKRKQAAEPLKKKFHEGNRDMLIKDKGLHSGRDYEEPRIYSHEKKGILVHFLLATRVWSSRVEDFLEKAEETFESKLDLVIMNSVLWDVNRWGPFGIEEYKKNLASLLKCVKRVLAEDGMFIWLTAQPGGEYLNSRAMETPGLEFQKITTRFNVVQANFYAAHKVAEAGFDVIDLHYYFLSQQFRRLPDGIHWTPEANRYATNLILTHLALRDNDTLPGRNVDNYALQRVKYMSDIAKGKLTSKKEIQERLKQLDDLAKSMSRENHAHVGLPQPVRTNVDRAQHRNEMVRPPYQQRPPRHHFNERPNNPYGYCPRGPPMMGMQRPQIPIWEVPMRNVELPMRGPMPQNFGQNFGSNWGPFQQNQQPNSFMNPMLGPGFQGGPPHRQPFQRPQQQQGFPQFPEPQLDFQNDVMPSMCHGGPNFQFGPRYYQ